MTFGDIASLAVALSDLKVVQSVTRAINANLPKTGPLGTIPAATRSLDPRPRLRATPERSFAARQVLHPKAKIDVARHAAQRCDRYEPSTKPADVIIQNVVIESDNRTKSPFLPVWATLPPVKTVETVRVIKTVHQKVDLVSRGSVIDIFV